LLFDIAAQEYDAIRDPWYTWLYARLHLLIAEQLALFRSQQMVLDIGCGTGFQSFLYSYTGHDVVGIDISPELLKIASQKSQAVDRLCNFLVPTNFPFARTIERRVKALVYRHRVFFPRRPSFVIGDAKALPLPDAVVDHINCCGSTLSLIADYRSALCEMARVLKPNGTFIIEVEARFNADLLWTLIDTMIGGRIGYGLTFKEACSLLKGPMQEHVTIRYPLRDVANQLLLELILFNATKLKRELSELGLQPKKIRSIHSITNLLPSTICSRPIQSRWLPLAFGVLAKMEQLCPWRLPGCSLVLVGSKK